MMRLAVLSDIHDQAQHLRSMLALVRDAKPDALILCGDLTRPAVLEGCRLPGVTLAFCLGNCDASGAEGLKQAALGLGAAAWGDLGVMALPEGGSVAFSHFPFLARKAALEGGHRAVFYGHTHRPHLERLQVGGREVLYANPGDVEGRYGRVSGLVWDSLSGQVEWLDA